MRLWPLAVNGSHGMIQLETERRMSKSLARVKAALQAAGLRVEPQEMPDETRTAAQAAAAAGCHVDQIVKSILFQGTDSGRLYLFLTPGGRAVDPGRARQLAGEGLARAEVARVREVTGFAIGGVAPLGHLTPLPVWMDRGLLAFDEVWAAAGTPRHIFPCPPGVLAQAAGATLADFTA
jgi:prolyl-tRNA editing enzyme YbaK/EbsC (Cys-tRNA(Pro) deacylase)